MLQRPATFNAFEFVVLAGLPTAQLMRGCTPRVESSHKLIVTAQIEVASGTVARAHGACLHGRQNLNAYAERFLRTIKESCLDRMIFFSESGWRHTSQQSRARLDSSPGRFEYAS